MRQRKVKNLDEKLASVNEFLIENPESLKGKWHEIFGNNNPICLEIGCGKGKFLMGYADSNPNKNYIGIEGQGSVVLRALEKAAARTGRPDNIRFMCGFVNDITAFFDKGELDTVYLNFSDPWPKDRHAKRRLTYGGRLKNYFDALKAEGHIEIKTDNDKLFEFTMEQINECQFTVLEYTTDLHNEEFDARLITTEYEDKFKGMGKNINYVKIKK